MSKKYLIIASVLVVGVGVGVLLFFSKTQKEKDVPQTPIPKSAVQSDVIKFTPFKKINGTVRSIESGVVVVQSQSGEEYRARFDFGTQLLSSFIDREKRVERITSQANNPSSTTSPLKKGMVVEVLSKDSIMSGTLFHADQIYYSK